MIVTCESCKARYKLDDARITGRGAKITCPRCKTVFVVYARDAVVSAPSSATTEAAVEEDDDGDEPTRRGAAVTMPVAAAREDSLPTKAAVPVELEARAAALDFKTVGVNAWKVKVKIGLIYDFSDLKTLRKYITDARVATTDVISYDGKNWRVIGDIPDLDAYFVETWETLSVAYRESPPPAKKSPTVEVEVKKGEPEATRFSDPFQESRKKTESKRRPSGTGAVAARPKDGKKSGASSSTGRLAVAAVVLLLVGGGWRMTRAPETPPSADSVSSSTPKVDAGAAQAGAGTATPPADAAPAVDPTIQKLNAEMAAVQARASELPQDAEPQVLIPIRRDGAAPTMASGSTATSATSATTASGAGGAPSMKSSAATAGEFEQAGDAEGKLGNWTTAIAAYRKAISLDSKSGNVHFKLGYSLYRAKDDAAVVSLDAAARLGRTDAYKLLGDIAVDQGDISGAMSRYQQYLKTKPRDAADIERKMRELSGG